MKNGEKIDDIGDLITIISLFIYNHIKRRGIETLFTLMTKESAYEIAHWTYAGIYSCYSLEGSDEILEELMNGEYYVAYGNENNILGYICIGKSAQIPTIKEKVYIDETVLDIGLGLIREENENQSDWSHSK